MLQIINMVITLAPWVKSHGILIITIYSILVLLIYMLIIIYNAYNYSSKLKKKLKRVKKNNKALEEQMNIYKSEIQEYKVANDFKNEVINKQQLKMQAIEYLLQNSDDLVSIEEIINDKNRKNN